ncbi:hypothetical protein SK128_007192 [Halocaridina rubra]|uniref:Uncharacterized protein n=1 Tax=Halocaridina rubra TaxID=373956 RepID=A0AAN9A0Q0_HALRR
MVAPYNIGKPIQSYVRIPGSGTDPKGESVFCDLSRVSVDAASVPVPQNRDHETAHASSPGLPPNPQAACGNNSTTKNIEKEKSKESVLSNTVASGIQRNGESLRNTPRVRLIVRAQGRPDESRNTAAVNVIQSSRKRPHSTDKENIEGEQLSTEIPIRKIRVTSQGAGGSGQGRLTTRTGSVGINTVNCEKCLLSAGTQTRDLLNKVIKERNELREKNVLLERRLNILKKIFQDKERLAQLRLYKFL